MPNIDLYIIIFSGIIFAISTVMLVLHIVKSVNFRKKIALPHGFSEGILTGPFYPALIAFYGLILIQFIFFLIIRTRSELVLIVRLILFIFSMLGFVISKKLTPPLLAYWFGRLSFWENSGECGRIPYTEIYGARIYRSKNAKVINSQQLYKISFYVKNKTFFSFSKKYVCRMTARQISTIAKHIDFKNKNYLNPHASVRAVLYSVTIPVLSFCLILVVFLQLASTGFLNPEKYTHSDTPLTNEISTVTRISDIFSDGERLYVYYNAIGAVNVYTPDGEFIYALSLPKSIFKHSEICISNDELLYRLGDEILIYSSDGIYKASVPLSEVPEEYFESKSRVIDGREYYYDSFNVYYTLTDEKKAVITKPAGYVFFDISLLWSVNLMIIIALFLATFFLEKTAKEDSDKHQPDN